MKAGVHCPYHACAAIAWREPPAGRRLSPTTGRPVSRASGPNSDCVIRRKAATDSDAIWPPIPTEVGHPFRSKPATLLRPV